MQDNSRSTPCGWIGIEEVEYLLLHPLEIARNQKRNVILIGNSGTGKTHLAIAVGIRACEENYRVTFRTAAALINQ